MSVRARDSIAIVEMKTRGIIKVGRLEDGCLYQEVYLGPAICRYRRDDYCLLDCSKTLQSFFALVKGEFINYFNKLGYYQAEKIPVPGRGNEEGNWEDDLDPIPF
ncbi:hypothetical protein [Okeania sp. SIO1I7]|uniref:hypothetical protein n=1 Tax=Okeania sp. SIO1I7 TaxID=2607772 RepID=UPI0013F9B3C3|nr:hypothetical protein [Okeania sp. SIO1I7]NET30012.1 hypothetical protein [Okeania sp. SIO1I7]